MGKAARFACIFLPLLLTIAALISLLIVFLGGTNKSVSALRGLYIWKADTSDFTSNPDILEDSTLDDSFLSSLDSSASANNLKDFYTIYLWNYCSGEGEGGSADEYKQCSGRQAGYAFDPVDVWGLEGTAVDEHFPDQLDRGLRIYRQVVRWMFAAYALAFFATAAEIVVGIFAICSRWGSFVTTIVATAAFLLTFAASLTCTIVSSTLVGAINTTLGPYNISASLGRSFLTVTWLAVAFSLGAGVFWLFSTCCVSGRSNSAGGKKKKGGAAGVEKAPYSYERVGASPYLGGPSASSAAAMQTGQSVPLRDMSSHKANSAYEPYRQV